MALKGLYVEQAGTQSLNNFPVAYKPGTAEWSQSAWVWLDTPVASNYGMGIAGLHNDNDTGTSERTLAIVGRSHGPVLLSYTYDTGIRHNETVTTVPIGRWVHVGVSAVANGRHVLWLDGKPSRYATGGGFFTGYGTVRASLSGTQIGSGSANAQSPRQRIADVAMWDVALSDEDMLALATKQARPTQIQYGRCFAFFPLNRSFINLRSPERGSPNLAELANFRLDQQSPFEGLPGLNLYGALGLSSRRVAPAGGANIQAGLTDTGTAGDAVASDLVARQLGGFTLLFSGLLRPGTSTLTTSELADALAAADTVASQVTLLGALSDALAAGEVVLVNGTFQAAASDSAAAGDTLAAIGTLQATMADSAATSDTVASASVLVSLLADSATAGDTVTGGVALISLVSDSAAAADTVVSSSAYASAIADSVSATDAVSAAATLLGALAETITAADAASAAAQLQAQIAEALAAADLPIAVLSGLGTITESVVLADGASAIATLSVTLSEAVATGDAVTAPSAATYQINVSVAWAAPAGARIWAAPATARTWVAPSINRVWN